MATQAHTSQPIDPAQAQAAYAALESELKALPANALIPVRVDAQQAATHAYGLALRDSAPERAPGFQKLVKAGVIDAHPAERLERAALAAWYARQQQLRFAAPAGVLVTAPVAQQADAVKHRMLKVVEYAFGDDPRFSTEIATIRSGTGYQDTANDLQQLADLYETPDITRVIKHDPVNYRSTDVADARRLAGQIFTALGQDAPDAAAWTDRTQRAYTHLTDVYNEHVYAGDLLFFRTEDVAATYPPSLVSVVRASPHAASGNGASDGQTANAPPATATAASATATSTATTRPAIPAAATTPTTGGQGGSATGQGGA